MKKLRNLAVVVGIAAMAISVALPANAISNKNKLHLHAYNVGAGGASASWQTGNDSPADGPNNQFVSLTTDFSNYPTDWGYSYATNGNTGINKKGVAVGNVRNLSFDFENDNPGNGYVGAGSPRISVGIDIAGDHGIDGYAYLSAGYCNTPYASPDDDWSRADFTGQTAAGCTIIFSDQTDPNNPVLSSYASSGTSSAWAVFATAHPSYIARSAFVVLDEQGTAHLDRIAIHNKMFTAKNKTVNCPTENDC
jgi:hypothetical protein